MAVIKVIELVGTSPDGWHAAAENAVSTSAKTIRDIVGVELVAATAKVTGQQISEYRATVKIAFMVREKVE